MKGAQEKYEKADASDKEEKYGEADVENQLGTMGGT